MSEASGKGVDVVVHARGKVVAIDDGSSVGVELKEVDPVDVAGGMTEHLQGEGTKRGK